MRPDVKLGIVSSMMVILVAGGYYFYRDGSDGAIPVSSGVIATGKKVSPGTRVANKPIQSKAKRKAITPARRRPSSGKNMLVKANRSVNKLGTKKPAVRSRVANSGAGRKSSPARRGPGKVTLPVVNKTKRPSRPIANKSVAMKKTPIANRLASNRSKKNNVGLAATKSKKPVKVKTPVGKADEAVERHRVQPGDTMASLALNYYGDEKYTRFLINHNTQLTNPTQLRVGTMVLIPSRPADTMLLAATRRVNRPVVKKTRKASMAKKLQPRMYTVQSGDSFYSIARDELGDAAQWQKLFELNKAVVKGDARKLQIGQVIKLPG